MATNPLNPNDAIALRDGVVQESDAAYETDALVENPKMGLAEIEEQTSPKKEEDVPVKCSTKCAIETQAVEGAAALIEPHFLGNGKLLNGTEAGNGKKKERRPKRRGGRARRNNKDVVNFDDFYVNKEKKGYRYSRAEMEVLRFWDLEEQKKRWVEAYCGLGPLVAKEYDGLLELDKTNGKYIVEFDPRVHFQKSANFGKDNVQSADNNFENLNKSDTSSSLPIGDEIESFVEEECSQDDDSDEDYNSIQRPAFVVTGEPDFDSGPPQDGLEYLRRVRWEAARIPKVKVAKVTKVKEQSVYMPQIPDIMKCPENLLPQKEWEDSFLAEFSELRLAFTQLDVQNSITKSSIELPPAHEEDVTGQILRSNTFEKFVSSTHAANDSGISEASCMLETVSNAKVNTHSPQNSSSIADPPTMSAILKMDSAARTSMLKKRIRSIENMSTLSREDSLWLFALCATVDCPLDSDMSACVRSLLRKCAILRAAKTQVDDEVVILNILVTISGRYFGQLGRVGLLSATSDKIH